MAQDDGEKSNARSRTAKEWHTLLKSGGRENHPIYNYNFALHTYRGNNCGCYTIVEEMFVRIGISHGGFSHTNITIPYFYCNCKNAFSNPYPRNLRKLAAFKMSSPMCSSLFSASARNMHRVMSLCELLISKSPMSSLSFILIL